MAVSVTTLTQDERDLAAANKPFLASVPDPDDRVDSKWVTGTRNGNGTSTSDDLTAAPSSRAVDGLPGLQTRGTNSSTLWTLVYNFSPGIEFDLIGYLNHNFSSLVTDLTLQVADNNLFTTNLRTLSTLDPSLLSSDRRFADFTLIDTGSDAQRFSNVEWLRLQFTASSSMIPLLGQMALGRRRQLKYEPNRPWDPDDLHTSLDRFESRAGMIVDTVRHRGRRQILANLNPDSDPYRQDLIDWYRATNHGGLPFVWVDKPSLNPNDFWFMKQDEPSLEYPYVLWGTREFVLRAKEQGTPFFERDP